MGCREMRVEGLGGGEKAFVSPEPGGKLMGRLGTPRPTEGVRSWVPMCSFAAGRGTGSSRQLQGGGKYLPREVMPGEGGSGPGRGKDLALAHPSSPLDRDQGR